MLPGMADDKRLRDFNAFPLPVWSTELLCSVIYYRYRARSFTQKRNIGRVCLIRTLTGRIENTAIVDVVTHRGKQNPPRTIANLISTARKTRTEEFTVLMLYCTQIVYSSETTRVN